MSTLSISRKYSLPKLDTPSSPTTPGSLPSPLDDVKSPTHKRSSYCQSDDTGSPMKGNRGSRSSMGTVALFEKPISTRSSAMVILDRILNHTVTTVIMTTWTVYALFADDIRVLSTDSSYDDGFFGTTCVALAFFTVELVAASISRPGYFMSFFFWLDVLSTVSLIPDIGWIWDSIVNSSSANGVSGAAAIAKTGRASRAASRASRIIRIVRLIRLIKVYKQAQAHLNTDEVKNNQVVDLQSRVKIGPESRVGKKLSELTTQRVVVLVLIMLFSTSIFDPDQYFSSSTTSREYGLSEILIAYNGGNTTASAFNKTVSTFIDLHRRSYSSTPLIYLNIENIYIYKWSPAYTALRSSSEVDFVAESNSLAAFDLRQYSQISAGLNIARTVFICIVLTVSALFFSKDTQELVLGPIERIIAKITEIATNPLAAARNQQAEEELLRQAEEKKKKDSTVGKIEKKKKKDQPVYETTMLEHTITKIGGLLALGFGEAGSEIIASNMGNNGNLNPMIPGRKILAIFGFCDIRQFTDATEVLQEGVMMFVNQIASIVHTIVDRFGGSANKNIGDAFLLVWKFNEDDMIEGEDGTLLLRPMSKSVNRLADMSLIAFLKIIAKTHRSPELAVYSQNKALCERMPNYKVKMGFGLHVGWAIEGAIGSEFKVDASYLSPNVNMASRLEAATKQYDVQLLVSSAFHDILSKETKRTCRHIDTVTVKGSKQPMGLYTVDIDPSVFKVDHRLPGTGLAAERDHNRKRKQRLRQNLELDNFNVYSLFQTDPDLQAMRSNIPESFIEDHTKGMQSYISGDWGLAKVQLEQCQTKKGRPDGPSQTILSFMSGFEYSAPQDWAGFRELTEK
eukprot:GILI01004220.1.p1 GENE.GILI01004220.1~~GILI01004220.1.p1  ORF type:complete len:852 (+),score=253.70 GILI01004220.1:189-2744(+)